MNKNVHGWDRKSEKPFIKRELETKLKLYCISVACEAKGEQRFYIPITGDFL